MRFFFSEELKADTEVIELNAEDSRHCVKVLRLRENDSITLTDGAGGLYTGYISRADMRQCQVKIQDYAFHPVPNHYIHIALAPTKNIDRIEWFVEKSVEMGIQEISFFTSRYSERKVLKKERLERIAISALKQSLQYHLPKINPITSLEEVIKNIPESTIRYIAWTPEDRENHFLKRVQPDQSCCILIGPEGGFSIEEVKRAKLLSFEAVSLGNSRLRTETAAVAATYILNIVNSL